MGQRWIKRESPQERLLRRSGPAAQFQNASEFEMRVRQARVIGKRPPVRQLGILLPSLLQRMTILNPDRRVGGIPIEGATVQARRDLPLPQISGTVGERDYALLAALAPPPCPQPIGLVRRNR